MVGGSSIRKAIGVTGGDVEGIEDPQAIFQIGNSLAQCLPIRRGQIKEGPAKAMAPGLLTTLQMQSLERLFHSLSDWCIQSAERLIQTGTEPEADSRW